MSETNGLATRESFRSASERRFTVTPELPLFGRVRIRSITDRERRQLDAHKTYEVDDEGKLEAVRMDELFARTAILMVVDAEGLQIFGEADVGWLADLDLAATQPLMREMNRHAELGEHTPTNADLKKTSTTATST